MADNSYAIFGVIHIAFSIVRSDFHLHFDLVVLFSLNKVATSRLAFMFTYFL